MSSHGHSHSHVHGEQCQHDHDHHSRDPEPPIIVPDTRAALTEAMAGDAMGGADLLIMAVRSLA